MAILIFVGSEIPEKTRKPHWVSDDIESFFHVINWLALRFHHHNVEALVEHVHSRYEFYKIVNGHDVGGGAKYQDIMTGRPPFSLNNNPPFMALLKALARACYQHYCAVDIDALEQNYGEPNATAIRRVTSQDANYEDFLAQLGVSSRVSKPSGTSAKRAKHIPMLDPDLPPELLLDTHEAFLDIMTDALEDALNWPMSDKLEDQFAGLKRQPDLSSKREARILIPVGSQWRRTELGIQEEPRLLGRRITSLRSGSRQASAEGNGGASGSQQVSKVGRPKISESSNTVSGSGSKRKLSDDKEVETTSRNAKRAKPSDES